jgi:hypothetical protein
MTGTLTMSKAASLSLYHLELRYFQVNATTCPFSNRKCAPVQSDLDQGKRSACKCTSSKIGAKLRDLLYQYG